jgi:hypothetical protein
MSAVDIELLENGGLVENELSHSDRVAYLADELAKLPQEDAPVTHRFAPGVYLREIAMPADSIVIGRVHRTRHFNVLLSGACLIVHADGTQEELRAPMTFISEAGVQKVLYILEDMRWQTIHPTEETDLAKLDEMLVEPVPQNILEQRMRALAAFSGEAGT